MLVSAWNPSVLPDTSVSFDENVANNKAALPPAMLSFNFMLLMENYLSTLSTQRRLFLGVPFNIASYALLTLMMAQVCELEAGDFVHTFGDAHIYSNHKEQIELQLSRTPRSLPTMKINPEVKDLFEFTFEDFELINYDPHPLIKGSVAI